MRKRWRMIYLGALAALLAGCATPSAPYNPYRRSPADLHSQVRTVAVAPVKIFCCVEDPPAVREKFARWTEAQLREAGFVVVDTAVYEEVWRRIGEEMGGFFDPVTGKFAATGSTTTGRVAATATLLLGGQVLVAGGSNLASAELYQP